MREKRNKPIKLNQAGMTMVELTVTFAILGLFLVAAARVISYSVNIYYAARGASYGLEVTGMISNKVVGMMEGAENLPEISAGGDAVSFVDRTGSLVTIGTVSGVGGTYLNIHYAPASFQSIQYEATDFRFDEKAYMGYEIERLIFSYPDGVGAAESERVYPADVIKMELVLKSDKYGTYDTTRYIKCVRAH